MTFVAFSYEWFALSEIFTLFLFGAEILNDIYWPHAAPNKISLKIRSRFETQALAVV